MLTTKGGKMKAFRIRSISWRAKGVYGLMIFSKKEARYTFSEILINTKESRTATMCALAELEKSGLIFVDRNVYPFRYCISSEEGEQE